MENTNLNIPQLRFPEFKDEWEMKKLEDISEINPKSNNLPDSFIYIDLESVKNGLLSKESRITKINSPSRAQRLLMKGDILYQTVRPYQKNNYFFDKNENDYVASTGYAQIRTKQSSQFIFQLFHTTKFVNKILLRCTGTSYPAINSTDLSKTPISIPTLPEQKKIADFLTAIDSKLQALKKKKALLEEYKKGIMQKIFSQEIRFKDDNGNDFPEWEVKKFREVYSFFSTNSLSREKLNYKNGSVKNIHYGDIHTKFSTLFHIKEEVVPFVNEEVNISKIPNENYCKNGDLVIADASEDYADIGKTIEIVDLNNEKVIAGLHTFLARPKKDMVVTGYVSYLVQSWNVRKQVMTIAQGTKVLSLSTTRLGNVFLNLPSIAEQTKIANFFTTIDDKINKTQSQIVQSEQYKKGLLQKMFV